MPQPVRAQRSPLSTLFAALRPVLAGAVVAVCAVVSALAQTPPPLPASVGTATGTLTAGATTITLKHAYVLPFTMFDEPAFQVLITDQPIPAAALAKEVARGGQALLKAGTLSGVSLLLGPDGSIRNLVPYISDLRGSRMLASAGTLTDFKASPTQVTGRDARGPDRTSGQGWSYTAAWNAQVVKP